MNIHSEESFAKALAYRDSNDYPFDSQGNPLPLKYDHEFEWSTPTFSDPSNYIFGSCGSYL